MAQNQDLQRVEDCLRQALEEIVRRRNDSSLRVDPGMARSSTEANSTLTMPSVSGIPTGDESAPPSSHLSEMRRLFSPYPQASSGGRNRGNNSRGRHIAVRFRQEFCCLAFPTDLVPSPSRKEKLGEHGLGSRVIELVRTATATEVEMAIREAFPKLEDIPFDLMLQDPGSRNAALTRLTGMGIPNASLIIGRRLAIVFVRPKRNLSVPILPTEAMTMKPQKFFLLQYPTDLRVPSRAAERELNDGGLGLKQLSIGTIGIPAREMTPENFKELIWDCYKQCQGVDFELMRRASNGNNAPLVRLDPLVEIPSTSAILSSRAATIFIRPKTPLTLSEFRYADTTNRFLQKMFCLGSPNDRFFPDEVKLQQYRELGLGEREIELDSSQNSGEVETIIRANFPLLRDSPFQILKLLNEESRSLVALSPFVPIPDAAYLKLRDQCLIFIRPFRDINGNSLLVVTTSAENLPSDPPAESNPVFIGAPLAFPSSSNCIELRVDEQPEQMNLSQAPATTTGGFSFEMEETSGSTREVLLHLSLAEEEKENDINDLLAVNDFRVGQRNKYPDQEESIFVNRDDLEDLLSIYKKPDFKFEKRTNVRYIGEPGRDEGAISKEFFTVSMKLLKSKLLYGKHSFFAGEQDHLAPNQDPLLLSAGHFKFLGKFMAHSFIQTGIAFIGLSEPSVRYLFLKDEVFLSSLKIVEQDVPSMDIREAQNLKIKTGIPISNADFDALSTTLGEAGLLQLEKPTSSNAQLLSDQLSFYSLFYSRAAYFDAIRDGMRETEAFQFLKYRPRLWKLVFPRSSDFWYGGEDIVSLMRYTGSENNVLKIVLEDFIKSLAKEDIQKLLQAWTGWQVLPDEGLEVNIKEAGLFIFHSCFNQLEIPHEISIDELAANLKNAIEYGYVGFGTA